MLNEKLEILVLEKYSDINDFIRKSSQSINKIKEENCFDKNKILLNPDLKPLTLNVQKAVEMILNFKLEPFKDNQFGPSQLNTQSRSTHYEVDMEDVRRSLPPVENPKNKRPPPGQMIDSVHKSFNYDNQNSTALSNKDLTAGRRGSTPGFERYANKFFI